MHAMLFALLLQAAVSGAPAPRQEPTPEPPQYEIVQQEGSPVRIASIKTKWAVPERTGIEIYITVENVDRKAVSTYSTRDVGGARERDAESPKHCLVMSANSPGKALRPGASEGRSTWTGIGPNIQHSFRRAVDWVEFTDGTTWGDDICHTAETLAAWRAGMRAARELLREAFAAGGADAVLEMLKGGGLKVSPPEGHTPEWQRDFRGGVESYVKRVQEANQQWGYTEIEQALVRPIDALNESEP